MAADEVAPTPPGDPQGLPPRPTPYGAVPGNIQFARCEPIDGAPEPVLAMIYDSPDVRVVSYWSESAFVALARKMLAFTGEPVLSVADESDLKALRDASPFEKP